MRVRCRRSSGRTDRPTFAKHTIDVGYRRHAMLDDFDGDGDIDIVGRRTQFSKVKNAERTTSSPGEATRIRSS
jgi:hypothetical protein